MGVDRVGLGGDSGIQAKKAHTESKTASKLVAEVVLLKLQLMGLAPKSPYTHYTAGEIKVSDPTLLHTSVDRYLLHSERYSVTKTRDIVFEWRSVSITYYRVRLSLFQNEKFTYKNEFSDSKVTHDETAFAERDNGWKVCRAEVEGSDDSTKGTIVVEMHTNDKNVLEFFNQMLSFDK